MNNSAINHSADNNPMPYSPVMDAPPGSVSLAGNPGGAVIQNTIPQPKRMGQRFRKMLDDFQYFGIGSFLYGILFTICLYKGFHGISLPALSLATMVYLLLGFKRLDIKAGKSAWFYLSAWLVLSISNCLTGSQVLIFFNICGILLLLLSFLLINFCDTKGWGLGKFFGEMFLAPFAAVAYVGYPFKSVGQFIKSRKKGDSKLAGYIWLGIFISIPLLVVIIGLLVSADAVFRNLFELIFNYSYIKVPERPVYMCILLIVGILGSYGIMAYLADGNINNAVPEKKPWEPVVGITFLSIITFVYLVFSVIQISYLFLGNFDLPEGYTYAAYAREGFFQLLFVCLINLVIILVCVSRFRENIALKLILTIFSCCTYIMIASSALRMILYVESYQLTFLRILVLWALVVIAVLLVGCMITIYKKGFPLLQYITAAVTIFYIAFSLAKPDYLIAKYNLTYNREVVDLSYLVSLSTDAVPAMEEAGIIEEILEKDGAVVMESGVISSDERAASIYARNLQFKADLSDEMGILDFNISYYRAGDILSRYEIQAEEK